MRAAALALALSATPTLAQAPTCHDLSGLDLVAQDAMTQLHLSGLVLRVDQHGQNVYAQTFGAHSPGQMMALASATKTLSVAVLLSLCDQGLLRLDDPVGNYLPEYATGALAAITLRMCFAHTSGLPALAAPLDNQAITMRQAAQQIAQLPLNFAPGTQFGYGEVSMQVGGAVCEVVTGLPWSQLFQQRIGAPLGMTLTNYNAYGVSLNPRVADGGASNADEYNRFLEMLRQGGTFNNQQVLSAAAVATMLTDQMSWLTLRSTPHPRGVPCGLGCWLEQQDAQGRTTLASMPGLYGFFGWLDTARDSTGVWLATCFYSFAFPFVDRCQAVAATALAPLGVRCAGSATPACAPTARLWATTWARAGQGDFGFAVEDAPPQSVGGLVLAFGPATPGLAIGDVVSFVPVAPLAVLPLLPDALGNAAIAAPLPALQGATVTLQGFWFDPGGCGALSLRASQAVQLDVMAR